MNTSAFPAELDHIVYAVPDLADGVRDFADLTGLLPAYGGAHVGLGTANYLVAMIPQGWQEDARTYLEILGPDPLQGASLAPGQLGNTASARLQRWAVHPADFTATSERASAAGVPVGQAHAMSRVTPDGAVLNWRLTTPDEDAGGAQVIPYGGALPFLIDWQDSQHPAERLRTVPAATLCDLSFFGPDPDALIAALTTLGVDADVDAAPSPGFAAILDTPRGRVELSTEHPLQPIVQG